VASVYFPAINHGSRRDFEGELRLRMNLIRGVIADLERYHTHERVEVIVAGDSNRHEQLWGGDAAGASPRQGEAEGLEKSKKIKFAAEE